MATSLAATLKLSLSATYKAKTAGDDLSVPTLVLTKSVTDTLANGEGSGQAEVVYSDTLSGGSPYTIDVLVILLVWILSRVCLSITALQLQANILMYLAVPACSQLDISVVILTRLGCIPKVSYFSGPPVQ